MLLFDEDESLAEQIRTLVPALQVIRVKVGSAYQRGDSIAAIRSDEEADFKRLIEEVTPDYIVHRWAQPDA